MFRFILKSISVGIILVAIVGCSSSNSRLPQSSPIDPGLGGNISQSESVSPESHTGLCGYYDLYFDFENGTVEVVRDRSAEFTLNLTNIFNQVMGSLKIKLHDLDIQPSYVDIDFDMSITHPFPGNPDFNAYDLRGIIMGNGSGEMMLDVDLKYPIKGVDLTMMDDPEYGGDDLPGGGPDGYSRWYNATEFTGDVPIFSYTDGQYGTPGFNGTGTVNPYKYFATGLQPSEDLWYWLVDNDSTHGVFSQSSTCDRNYYLRFPTPQPGIYLGYAVVANWSGTGTQNHPSNTPEAVGCKVDDSSDLYWSSPNIYGGNLILDVSIFDWKAQPDKIFIESTVLDTWHEFDGAEMQAVSGSDFVSTYHVEIPAETIDSSAGNEFWVITEFDDYTYNTGSVPNLANGDPLMAFFRYDLAVGPGGQTELPICSVDVVTPMPICGFAPLMVEFDASGSYDPDGGAIVSYEWDFDNDGIFGDAFDSGTDSNPVKGFLLPNLDQVCVRITDDDGESSECCVNVAINAEGPKNIHLRDDALAMDIALEPDGDLVVLYDDAEVWRYYEASGYNHALADYIFTATVVPWTSAGRPCDAYIDVSDDGNIFCSADDGTDFGSDSWPAQDFTSDGTPIGSAPAPGTGGPVPDIYVYPSGGYYSNNEMIIAPDSSGMQNNMYRYAGYWAQIYQTAGENAETGYDKVKFTNVVGAEGSSGDQFWVIEDAPDYYASRWMHTGSTWGYFNFDGAWFGAGAIATDDNDNTSWNHAKDLTMDSEGRFYVLDELSDGQGRIKLFESGSPGVALVDNVAGDADTISGAPLRIEGGKYVSPDYGNMIFVLHGDSIPCMVSVFFMEDFGF
jgi:hypothetical protein